MATLTAAPPEGTLVRQFQRIANLLTLMNGVSLRLIPNMEAIGNVDYPGAPPFLAASYHALERNEQIMMLPADTIACIELPHGSAFALVRMSQSESMAMMGPYCHARLSREEARTRFAGEELPQDEIDTCALYLSQLPVLTKTQAGGIMAELTNLFLDRDAVVTMVDLASDEAMVASVDDDQDDIPLGVVDSGQVRAIEKRYQDENELLDAIASGDVKRAMSAIEGWEPNGLHRNGDVVRDLKIELIILNTLTRKKLEDAGIRPYFIDAISTRWGLRIEATNDLGELKGLPYLMIEDYCRATKTYSLAGYSPNVRAALQHIHLHLTEETLSLSDIAASLKVNPTYLSHQFNKEVGMGVPEYVSRMRIDRAQTMLKRNENASVNSIARAVGFSDPAYFSRRFKEIVGCSPSTYRRSNEA